MHRIAKCVVVMVLVMPLVIGAQKKAAARKRPRPPAVVVKRVPAKESEGSESVPSPEKYKFREALKVLEASGDREVGQSLPGSTIARSPATRTDLSKSFPQGRDVRLSESAKEALDVSAHWQAKPNRPAEGEDGVAVFTYGAGLATLVCAPLRVCIVELQPGERITSEPHIGDSVRWFITPTISGSGGRSITNLVIKPKESGLDTNLFIPTDRRQYHLRLVSDAKAYIARMRWDYADEKASNWSDFIERQSFADPPPQTPAVLFENLYTDYKIKGGDENMRPVRVADDGEKTYIQITPAALHQEAPVLVAIGPDGKPEMVNYRVQGSVYVADRLFDRAALILGAGRKARKVQIIRGSAKRKALPGRNAYRELPKRKIG